MINKKIFLNNLEHSQYEHPFDKKALEALESTPGLGTIGKFITKYTVEKILTVQFTGSNLRVTKKSYPYIYEYLEYATQILNMPTLPELYVQWGYDINAFTVGAEHPIIVLNSGLIDLCTEDEILFIVGHECGHIKSNHMLYHMMGQVINNIVEAIPGGGYISSPLRYALMYWNRMSEFTADRAGALCCQNRTAVVHALMKMAGIPKSEYSRMDEEAFIKQAEDFELLDDDTYSVIVKFFSIIEASHPWTVMRASELLKWMTDGSYKSFIPISMDKEDIFQRRQKELNQLCIK